MKRMFSCMKLIVCLIGLGGLLAMTGCESDDHWEHHRGGVYDDSYRHYGHGEYRHDYDRDHGHWEHRDWNY
jgi:hypothetical protein